MDFEIPCIVYNWSINAYDYLYFDPLGTVDFSVSKLEFFFYFRNGITALSSLIAGCMHHCYHMYMGSRIKYH